MMELLNDKDVMPQKCPASALEINPQEKKNLSLNLVSIGSANRFNSSVSITIPPISYNQICVTTRENLPIHSRRQEILDLINFNQVILIESSTGSGKSTQVPQFILEECSVEKNPCRIIVAEPKRICAIALADRVSFERGEATGSTVGYQIRLESKVSPNSNLIYVTNGVILRMLMSGRPEKFFQSVTHLIIDEVHERDVFSDFLLLCIRDFIHVNPNLKIIIMSATIETNIFKDYFGGCPVFKQIGTSFEIEVNYMEDILKLLNFNNTNVDELLRHYEACPEMFDLTRIVVKDEKNLDDDTKDKVNELLEDMSTSIEADLHFLSFFYMVQAEQVPVDFRHLKTNKTALYIAVEKEMEKSVEKLLNLMADPTLTVEVDGKAKTSLDLAVEKNNTKIATLLVHHMEIVSGTRVASTSDTVQSTPFDRALLDIYYDTLVQPGNRRGVFLEDTIDLNMIKDLVRHLHFNTDKSFGILIFLPGHDEIVQLANLVYNALDTNYEMFLLHSQMMPNGHNSVFDKMPEGIRKIIISTNIAESSITVNDVVFVIDSGKSKQKTFNAMTHVSSLKPQWISKASAKQRMGRAGRLRDGVVFRMYSRDRYNNFVECSKPEFLRCDITNVCLQAKMIARSTESIGSFLKKAVTPPSDTTIYYSIKILQKLGALHHDETLTQLGLYLADIPLNANYGKMLIYGVLFKCLDPILTIVSILSIGEPFTLPRREQDRETFHAAKLKLEDGSYSDHFALLKVFQKWNEYKTTYGYDGGFCDDNFVNAGTLDRIATTRLKIVGYLRSVRVIQSIGNLSAYNEFSYSWATIKACLAAGSYPEIGRILKKKGDITTEVDHKIYINPGSVLRPKYGFKLGKEQFMTFPDEWIIFEEKNQSHGYLAMAKVCSLVTGICLIFTAGHGISVNEEMWSDGEHDKDCNVELEVDKFIKFSTNSSIAYVLQELREKLNTLMTRFLMNVEKFKFQENDEILIEGIVKLLELEDEKAGFKIIHEGIGARPRVVTRDNRSCTDSTHSLDASYQSTEGSVQRSNY